MSGNNEHHILFEKSLWKANEPLKKLRTSQGLKPQLDKYYHEALHAECSYVPAFSYLIGSQIYNRFIDRPDNPVIALENLLFAIDEVMQKPNIKIVERQIGELAIVSLEMQRPFIEDGLV